MPLLHKEMIYGTGILFKKFIGITKGLNTEFILEKNNP
jgi:hypothetical protein